MNDETKKRKADHIRISLKENVQAKSIMAGFEETNFVHRALPEVDRQKIDLTTTIFGHRFAAPLIVGAMTGGTREATKINSTIAEAVEKLGLGMGVGSQRAAIENKGLESTFAVTRKKAPTAFLIANIGGIQLTNRYGARELKKAIDMIRADAVAIHLNPLQETAQPEGQTNFAGVLDRIHRVTGEIDTPVIAKETGAGISAEESKKLEAAGVKGIDVSGAGGTSFAAIEYYRARTEKDCLPRRLGETFWDWGIPTAVSIVEVSKTVEIPVIASGGIRSGLDVAKSLALGARIASLSQPILQAAVKGVKETCNILSVIVDELRNVMFLTGAKSIKDMHNIPIVITGKTSEWLRARGFDTNSYARRGMR